MSAVLDFKQTVKNPYSSIYYPESDGKPMAETDLHIDLITYLKDALKQYFSADPNVYVSGCIMFYYVEGSTDECVSPDVMVCFGVPKGERRTYKVWEENYVVPSVIFEITSRKTSKADRVEKKELYALLGVREYFIYNPEHPKTLPALLAYRLNDNGKYEELEPVNQRIFSQILNLELAETNNTLRLFNPATNEFLPTAFELAEKAALLTEQVKAETQARIAAESEIERLRAELARLKTI